MPSPSTTCALALQQKMTQFKPISIPAGTTIPFSLKVAVTSGPARRFLVGYPTIQSIEVLAGKTLDRLATAEQQLHKGEIMVDAATVAQLGDNAQIRAQICLKSRVKAISTSKSTMAEGLQASQVGDCPKSGDLCPEENSSF